MNKRKVLRLVFLILAVVLIGLGIYTGDYLGVLRKATMICFECIGIG